MKITKENEKKRLLKHMKIPPKKKLEWLQQMNEFVGSCSAKQEILKTRQSLREKP